MLSANLMCVNTRTARGTRTDATWFGMPWHVFAALLVVWVVWGSTYLAIKIAIDTGVPPFVLIAARFFAAGSLLFGIARVRGERLPNALEWRNGALIGALMMAGGVGLTAFSEQAMSSSLTTIIIATGSILNVLATGAIAGDWPRRGEWIGIAIGLCGVVLLAFDGDIRANPLSAATQATALIFWAIGTGLSRKLVVAPGLMGSASEMLAGAGVLTVFSFLRGETLPAVITPTAWASWAYLTLAGSVLAYTAYQHLIKNARPALVTSYSYVNPVVALALGFTILGERVSTVALIAVTVIIAGVLLMARVRKR
jgi:drug/metabolite transporter (DMT)-like permease